MPQKRGGDHSHPKANVFWCVGKRPNIRKH
jgi:hypothetical protein